MTHLGKTDRKHHGQNREPWWVHTKSQALSHLFVASPSHFCLYVHTTQPSIMNPEYQEQGTVEMEISICMESKKFMVLCTIYSFSLFHQRFETVRAKVVSYAQGLKYHRKLLTKSDTVLSVERVTWMRNTKKLNCFCCKSLKVSKPLPFTGSISPLSPVVMAPDGWNADSSPLVFWWWWLNIRSGVLWFWQTGHCEPTEQAL